MSFELNLYGIEIIAQFSELETCCRLNWTFMELKSVLGQLGSAAIGGLNWTFMELKSGHKVIKMCERCSLNWTFMELKSIQRWRVTKGSIVWIEPLWNWNHWWAAWLSHILRLNWTFMELKSIYPNIALGKIAVWIEPLWNWNVIVRSLGKEKCISLNWTFMELKLL